MNNTDTNLTTGHTGRGPGVRALPSRPAVSDLTASQVAALPAIVADADDVQLYGAGRTVIAIVTRFTARAFSRDVALIGARGKVTYCN